MATLDDMREIVTMDQANGLFLALAIAGPLLGLLIGALVGRKHGELQLGAFKGLVVGMLGPLNLVLWKVYNALTDRMGLDTVKNLLVNLVLFAALGVVAGLVFGYYWRRNCPPPTGGYGAGGGLSPVAAGPGGPGSGAEPGGARTMEDAEAPPRDA